MLGARTQLLPLLGVSAALPLLRSFRRQKKTATAHCYEKLRMCAWPMASVSRAGCVSRAIDVRVATGMLMNFRGFKASNLLRVRVWAR